MDVVGYVYETEYLKASPRVDQSNQAGPRPTGSIYARLSYVLIVKQLLAHLPHR